MRNVIGGLIATAALCCPVAAAAVDNGAVAPASEIHHALDQYAAQFSNVGLVVGVVDNGKPATYTSGSLGPGAPTLDDRTTFEIGSVTKTFTATLLAQMVGTGSVALDDPIGKYLPAGVKAPSYGGEQITLANLAEQNSGLPRLPTNLDSKNPADPYATYTQANLDTFLSHATLDRAPGSSYEYSNLGVGLLGDLLARRAANTYDRVLDQRVLLPLGMTDTAVVPTAAMSAHLAPGHTIDNDPQGLWTFGPLAGAGGLISDGRDMLGYLQANLAAPDGPLGKAMAMAQEPRFDSDAEGRPMKIGLVWNVDPRTGIIWHNGEAGGYYAFIALDRANHNGIVLLANVADPHIDTLAMHLLEPDAVSAAPSWPAVVPVAPAALDMYAGTYQLSPNFALTVTHDGERVYAKGTGQANVRIYPSSPTEFFARAIDAQITFELDPSGHVARLILHQFGRDTPGPKVK